MGLGLGALDERGFKRRQVEGGCVGGEGGWEGGDWGLIINIKNHPSHAEIVSSVLVNRILH